MSKRNHIEKITMAAMLCAVGILIPSYFPKIAIPPVSYTLASHVAIFMAMFISPAVSIAVTLGTTLGFLISALPMVITLRALSHIVFSTLGSFYLKKTADALSNWKKTLFFGAAVSVIHALLEIIVVSFYYFGNALSEMNYTNGFFVSVILLIGVGGFVHSMIDYYISCLIWNPVAKVLKTDLSVKRISLK